MKNTFKNILAAGILTSVFLIGSASAKDGLMMSDFAGQGNQPCATNDASRGGIMISDRNGLLVSDRSGLMMSDRAGLLISDFASLAAANFTGILIVGKSGLMMSDFTGETSGCPQ